MGLQEIGSSGFRVGLTRSSANSGDGAASPTDVPPTRGPDQTFDIGILPRRPRGDLHLLDAQRLGSAGERDAVDRIAVAEELLRRGVPRERLDKLLGGPLGRGGVGDVDVEDASAVVREDHEDEQHLEQHRGQVKKSTATSVSTWLARNVRQVCRAWASGPRKLMKIVLG